MHETERLKRTLERAAEQSENGALMSPMECLARVLDEIDMVVLPRDVTFENELGQRLSVTVKSRRVIRINSPLPDVPGATPQVVDVELSANGHHITALAHLIAGFSAQTTELSTALAEVARPDVLNEMGVSVVQLRGALRDAGYAPLERQSDVFTALFTLADTQGLTWARFVSGDLDASGGDAEALREIEKTAVPYILKADRPAKGRIASWMLGPRGPSGSSPSIAITAGGDAVFIAVVPPDLTQAWIKACAGRATG